MNPSNLFWRLIPLAMACGLLAGASQLGASADDSANPQTDPASTASLRDRYAADPSAWPPAVVDAGVEPVELGLLPEPSFPDDNPYSKAKADLGEMLFFDPRLSASNQMACASCHDPDLGWADGKTVSFGTDRLVLARNAPTAMNSGHLGRLFWDGRASSLEELTVKVINNADELHGSGGDVAAKLNAIPEYRALFTAVFGGPQAGPVADAPGSDEPADAALHAEPGATATGPAEDRPPVTLDRVAKAVATFVRTVHGGRSRFDAFLKGRADALSDAELRGLHLFRTEARCMNCHHGPTLSDSKLHVTGLHLYGRAGEDLGAFRVTGHEADRGAFKTPPLRHISRTGPYMHHGLFESLRVTLRAYNGGMAVGRPRGAQLDDPRFPAQSPLIHELDLTESQLADIAAFLGSLEEPHRRIVPPDLPPGLHGRE